MKKYFTKSEIDIGIPQFLLSHAACCFIGEHSVEFYPLGRCPHRWLIAQNKRWPRVWAWSHPSPWYWLGAGAATSLSNVQIQCSRLQVFPVRKISCINLTVPADRWYNVTPMCSAICGWRRAHQFESFTRSYRQKQTKMSISLNITIHAF
jgi:hypothetical protein